MRYSHAFIHNYYVKKEILDREKNAEDRDHSTHFQDYSWFITTFRKCKKTKGRIKEHLHQGRMKVYICQVISRFGAQRSCTFLLPEQRRWAFHLLGRTEMLTCDPSHSGATQTFQYLCMRGIKTSSAIRNRLPIRVGTRSTL